MSHISASTSTPSSDLGLKMIDLIENKPLAEEIGEYNKVLIEANYTEEQMVDTFVESFIKHT